MSDLVIDVDMQLQQLYLWEPYPDGDMLIRQYPVSTAANGAGEEDGSHCTPRGRHRIAEKMVPLHHCVRPLSHVSPRAKCGRPNSTPSIPAATGS